MRKCTRIILTRVIQKKMPNRHPNSDYEFCFTLLLFNLMKSNNSPYDYLIKMILVGDTGVGKTSFLLRFTEQLFDNASHIATIGKFDCKHFCITSF